MKRVLLPLVVAAVAAGFRSFPSSHALACSAGPDYDPVAASEVIVAGRFLGWEVIENVRYWDERAEPAPVDDPNFYGFNAFVPIRVRMVVDRVYKGTVQPEVEMVAGNTLLDGDVTSAVDYQWVGSIGACGAFDADPTGRYGVMGLAKDKFGRYHPSLLSVFYFGDEPPTDFTRARMNKLTPLLPGSLPVNGGPPSVTEGVPSVSTIGALMIGPLAFLAGAAFLLRRGESHNG